MERKHGYFFYLRAIFGGILMGLANLVPGISGGTMLLVAGVYPPFIDSIAELTRLKFTKNNVLMIACVVFAAGLSILMMAGVIKELVINHRWIMYSLFIGLTFGGVPMIWRLAKPHSASVFVSAFISFILMVVMAVGFGSSSQSGESNLIVLIFAGASGASAMILPGVSGGYLLLLLGQYQNILGAIDQIKMGLLGDEALNIAPSVSGVLEAFPIVIPVGIGVLIGVVGVSNLLKWLMDRYEKETLGALLGLILGAVVGIWPFQEGVPPVIGQQIKGKILTAADLATIAPDDWPIAFFNPSGMQIVMSLAIVLGGFLLTQLVEMIGKKLD